MKKAIFIFSLVIIAIILFENFSTENKYIESIKVGGTEIFLKKDGSDFYLVKNKSFFNKAQLKLSGFENEVLFCPDFSTLKLNDDVVCLTGFVGAHSQNLQLVSIKDGDLGTVSFLTNGGNEAENIMSDLPKMRVIDYNEDGKDDIMVYNRNYDKDPLANSIVGTFEYEEGKYKFVEEREI